MSFCRHCIGHRSRPRERLGITSSLDHVLPPPPHRRRGLEATLEAALPYREMILGVGLDSTEVGNPPEKFADVFLRARHSVFRIVAHAGEEAPASYVWGALDILGAERIDHGVRSEEDPALLERLVEQRIPLTMCPLSNLALRVVDRLEDHNLKRLLDRGIVVTVNSDDPAYFGGYVLDNYMAAAASARPLGGGPVPSWPATRSRRASWARRARSGWSQSCSTWRRSTGWPSPPHRERPRGPRGARRASGAPRWVAARGGAVAGGRITEVVGYGDAPPGATVLDAGDRLVFPGLVDSHVHVNEPGRTHWEGFATATSGRRRRWHHRHRRHAAQLDPAHHRRAVAGGQAPCRRGPVRRGRRLLGWADPRFGGRDRGACR